MDALNFLKFWRHAAMAAAATTSLPHLAEEPENGSDEEDSFFDLELTVHDFNPQEDKSTRETKDNADDDDDNDEEVSEKPISKRKILPIEPISKPQSPMALLKSAHSFRIFASNKKPKEMPPPTKTEQTTSLKKETKRAFESSSSPFSTPVSLSRNGSSRSHGTKSERFSKEVLQKYLKLIKPLYVRISRRHGERMVKVSASEGILSSTTASSTTSSPSVVSVSSFRREKQGGNFPAGIRGACKHLGKSKSASASVVAGVGVGSPANRSDDTLLQQHDGIQSAILHCKRSFNSRDYASTITMSEEKSTCAVRKSF